MDYIIFFCIIAALGTAWYKHNKYLDAKQAQLETMDETDTSFDYMAAKEQTERQQKLLDRYEKINQLMDDIIVATDTGEEIPITISWYSHSGESRQVALSVEPESLADFAREMQRDCSVACNAALSTKRA